MPLAHDATSARSADLNGDVGVGTSATPHRPYHGARPFYWLAIGGPLTSPSWPDVAFGRGSMLDIIDLRSSMRTERYPLMMGPRPFIDDGDSACSRSIGLPWRYAL